MARTYWFESTGPAGKRIITETWCDNLGRVSEKSNPYFYGIDTPYYTSFTYDGLSRVIETQTPDGYYISTYYQGLKKVVTDQNNHSTTNTYDVYQRLKKVEDAYGTITEYNYDALGNLVQVIAAKNATEQNTTTMTYDSLSRKRSMTDPDMGYWTYEYDKSGNLEYQTDAKSQKIRLIYDGLNRVYEKWYGYPTPTSRVYFTYDDPLVPYSKGKQTKVSYQPSGEDLREDSILEYDLLQRVKKSKKKIGTNQVTFEKTYDSAGRVVSIKYTTPTVKTYNYKYDVAGNLLYIQDNATLNHLVDYSDFTALGQQKIATFPKPNNISVKTEYTYFPETGRLYTLLTRKMNNSTPLETFQNLTYSLYDGVGNIKTLTDSKNSITHTYEYDHLNRLTLAKGNDGATYQQNYTYDRIGNITYKSDVGNYAYTYSSRPHAVNSAGSFSFQYDLNGNMTQRTGGGVTITISSQNWNYENKPTQIQKGSATISLTYDGNGKRVKKVSSVSGTTLYYGELYEVRAGVGAIHLFADRNRVASVLLDGRTQFYHPNHLKSASFVTDQNGDKKEQIEYLPFGTYRAPGVPTGTYDYDPSFPDVFYTFTDQEDDDDLGLYNFKARLYDPLLGRFISPDSIVPDPGDPQAHNRYSYGRNNPINYTDPNGHLFTPFHAPATFMSELLRGSNPLQAFRITGNDLNVDLSEWRTSRDYQSSAERANLHNMRGYDSVLGRYQYPAEARAAIYKDAMEMYQKGEIGGVRHLLNDWVHGVFGLQSMKDYFGGGIFSEAAHALLYDFNPLAIAASTIVQTAFSLFPQGTIDLLFGGGSVAQQGTVGSDYSNTLVNSWNSYSNVSISSSVNNSDNSAGQSNPSSNYYYNYSYGGNLEYGSYDDFFWDWSWW